MKYRHQVPSVPGTSLVVRGFVLLFLLLLASTAAKSQGQAFIRINYPNGGNNLVVDSTVNIRWTAQGVTGTLNVEYSIDSGTVWTLIDTVTARNGADTLAWKVPNQPTTMAFVRVMAVDSSRSGRSARTFNIVTAPVPTLQVLAPNGGETYAFDDSVKVRWAAANITGMLDVEYSIDSGATWIKIASVPAVSGLDSLVWIIPHDTTSEAFVRVSTQDDSTSDRSNRTFTIRAAPLAPRIHLLYPNGGEVLYVDSIAAIRWETHDITGQLRVEYSVDSGRTWRNISNRLARDGFDTVAWTVPNDTTTSALVRVRMLQGTTRDTSDAFFTIARKGVVAEPPMVQLLSPNGGETLNADSTIYIRWMTTNFSGTLMVAYSPDGGATWTPITAVVAKDGIDSISWMVPDDSTGSAMIAIVTEDFKAGDTTNAPFMIIPKPKGAGLVNESIQASALQSLASYPNPSHGSFELCWTQKIAGNITLRLVDQRGEEIRIAEMGRREAGEQQLRVDDRDLPAGSYVYEIRIGEARATGMITIVR